MRHYLIKVKRVRGPDIMVWQWIAIDTEMNMEELKKYVENTMKGVVDQWFVFDSVEVKVNI